MLENSLWSVLVNFIRTIRRETRQLRLLHNADAPNATDEKDFSPGKAVCCRRWTYLSLHLIEYSIDCLEGGHGTVDLCGQVLIQWVGDVSIRQFCASTV